MLALLIAGAPLAGAAQQFRPSTMISTGVPAAGVPGTTGGSSAGAGATFAPGGVQPVVPAPNTLGAPALPGAAFDPYATPPPPAYGPTAPYNPGATGVPPYATVPADPAYGTSPPSLFPNSEFQFWTPEGNSVQWKRFLQGIRLQYTWLDGGTRNELGINDVDVGATFAFPIFPDQNHPLLVTPGFGLHFWEGPKTGNAFGSFDLPARAYEGYIEFGWNPQFSEWIGAELAVRPGVYTDFDTFNTDSWRLQGRGLGIVSVTRSLRIAGGVEFLDRNRVKLLPSGGVVWEPNDRSRYDIIFPRPKMSHFLYRSSFNTDWWGYVAGEYGGGSWTVERSAGFGDRVDINDIRVIVGVEFRPTPAVGGAVPILRRTYVGYIEAGYVFQREIVYVSNFPASTFEPDATLMLRGGLRF